MATSESGTRERLKIALQDVKRMFDEGLIDETEFKDLKAHELKKYKAELTSCMPAPSPQTPSPPNHLPRPVRTDSSSSPTDMVTPPQNETRRLNGDTSSSGEKERVPSLPQIRKRGYADFFNGTRDNDQLFLVEPEIYERLTTPPIFRRKPPAKRRIVLKSTELAALQTQSGNTL